MVYKLALERDRYQIRFPHLPLAVYREVAAHLRQVDRVEANLIPQTSHLFDYNESQIAGLWIQFATDASPQSRERVEQILGYYSDRYRPWEEYQD